MKDIKALAKEALRLDEEEWGSEAQIDSENEFFDVVREILPDSDMEDLEDYCLKATSTERIEEGLKMVLAK